MILALLPLAISLAAGQDGGAVDPTFKSGSGLSGSVSSIVVQNDGKILIAGSFTTYNNILANRIARLTSNGTLDTSFTLNSGSGANASINSVAVQSDGKILIAGDFTSYNGTARSRIARLNSNGALDASFNPGGGADDIVDSLAIQSDGKILIGGYFIKYNNTVRKYIARLNSDGALDTSFNLEANYPVTSIAIQNDGKILIGWSTYYNGTVANRVTRLNSDGTLDTSFNSDAEANNIINSIAIQNDGKILVGGDFSYYNNRALGGVVRLNSDGTPDTSFNPKPGTGANNYVRNIVIQSDGKILISGLFTSYNGTPRNYLARLNSDGTLDISFNPNSDISINYYYPSEYTVAVQSDGKILFGGTFIGYKGTSINNIAQLNSDGTLVTSFNAGDTANGADNVVHSIAVQNDGKILIGGEFINYSGTTRNRIARLNTDATLDTSFNPGDGPNNIVNSIVVQSDGKILIGGEFTSYSGIARHYIARLNSDGTLDTSFNSVSNVTDINYRVRSIVLQNDNKILIGGWFSDYNGTAVSHIARLNSDGTLDTSFNPGGGPNSVVNSTVVQNDGKILIVGYFSSYNGAIRNRIARLNSDGTLDTSFNPGGGPDSVVNSIAVQNDGKILVGGWFSKYNLLDRGRIVRLNSNGTLDSSFNPGGTGADDLMVNSIVIQSDGKILIGGGFANYNGTVSKQIARLNGDGTLDTSFNSGGGANNIVNSIALQNDNKILIGGMFTSVDTYTRNFVARLEGTSKLPTSISLISTSNPAQLGQSITFTATVQPIAASGTVTFTFDGVATAQGILVNGVATYVTNTLAAGTHNVTARYGGDSIYSSSTSQPVSQVIVAACNPQIVTNVYDDGQAGTCGSFSYALANTASGTISFALAAGNTITFTGGLTPTVKAGVAINGGTNGIILNGNGVAGEGLRLDGHNQLIDLTIRHFSGHELVVTGGTNRANQLYRIKLES